MDNTVKIQTKLYLSFPMALHVSQQCLQIFIPSKTAGILAQTAMTFLQI